MSRLMIDPPLPGVETPAFQAVFMGLAEGWAEGRINPLLTKNPGMERDRPLTVRKPYVPIYGLKGGDAHNM